LVTVPPRRALPGACASGSAGARLDGRQRAGENGIVSKRRDLPYRSARTKTWIKVKNPKSPAMLRVIDRTW
jgi:ATP-dependent DNA ligase